MEKPPEAAVINSRRQSDVHAEKYLSAEVDRMILGRPRSDAMRASSCCRLFVGKLDRNGKLVAQWELSSPVLEPLCPLIN